jgi:ADP-heptose:LPS heptosyltransferase
MLPSSSAVKLASTMNPAFAEAQRVLIVGGNHVGNNIFCTPAIHFLKRNFPSKTFDVLSTSSRGADAFKGNPDISGRHLAKTRWGMRRIASRYDFVIAMHESIADRCLSSITVPHAFIRPAPGLHRAEQRLAFAQSIAGGSIAAADRKYQIVWNASHEATIDRYLAQAGSRRLLVGLHLGCGKTSSHGWKFWYPQRNSDPKLWPLENYIELGKKLVSANPDIQLVITGSQNERFLAKRFVSAIPGTIDLVGKTSIQSVAALTSKLALFITQDTGILHVACASGVPLIALFGPTNVEATGPYPQGGRHTIIQKSSMAEISPTEVCQVAIELLRKKVGSDLNDMSAESHQAVAVTPSAI